MQWEYWTCHVEIDPQQSSPADLNALGQAGWELVTMVPIPGIAHHFRAFFKRVKT